jgi:hypothetical protein
VAERGIAKLPFEPRPLDQIVPGLERAREQIAAPPGGFDRLVDTIGGEVGKADRADLAKLHEAVERAEALVQRHALIILVLVIDRSIQSVPSRSREASHAE